MIRQFQKNSVLARMYSGLILISLIMIGIYSCLIHTTLSRNHRDQAHQRNFLILRQAAETTDLTLRSLERQMERLFRDDDLVRYASILGKDDASLEDSVLDKLEETSKNQKCIKRLWLYSPYSDAVLTSEGEKVQQTEFEDRAVLQHYQGRKADGEGEVHSEGQYADVFTWQSRLFLAADDILTEPAATLVCEVNVPGLYELLNVSPEGPIYLFDRDGAAIGQKWYQETGIQSMAPLQDVVLFYEDHMDTVPENAYYSYVSTEKEISVLKRLEAAELTLKTSAVIEILAPSCVFLILLTFVVVGIVTKLIYHPINQLIQLTQGIKKPRNQHQERRPANNELDYLKQSYTDMVNHNAQITQVMAGLTHDILEQVIKNLIMGKHVEHTRFRELLELLDTDIQIDCRCTALVCRLVSPEANELSLQESNAHYLAVCQAVSNQPCGEFDLICTQLEPGVMAAVFCFPPEYSMEQIPAEMQGVMQQIRQQAAQMDHPVVMEYGCICDSLMELSVSYRDASGRVNDQIYLSHSDPTDTAIEMAKEEELCPEPEHTTQLLQLLSAAEIEDTSVSDKLLDDLWNEIKESTDTSEHMLQRYRWLEEQLVVYLRSLPDEDGTENLETGDCDDEAVIRRNCAELLQKIRFYSGKSQHRYIAEAKSYIHLNYADCNLTARTVSEHLGIHVVYFGKLFNDQVKESFPAYLNQVRVKHAKDILAATEIPVKEVGFQCGFNAVQTFNRVFKKYVNMTPSQYRSSVRNGM